MFHVEHKFNKKITFTGNAVVLGVISIDILKSRDRNGFAPLDFNH